jgi:hypothetical protein
MKKLMPLVLAGALLVPLVSAQAVSAKSSVTAAHKKVSHHKRHARRAAKTSPASASAPKTPPSSTTPE